MVSSELNERYGTKEKWHGARPCARCHTSAHPLTAWSHAIYPRTANQGSSATLPLKRDLGVASHTDGWIKHRRLDAMAEREDSRHLSGAALSDGSSFEGECSGTRGGGREGTVPCSHGARTGHTMADRLVSRLRPIDSRSGDWLPVEINGNLANSSFCVVIEAMVRPWHLLYRFESGRAPLSFR